MEQEEQPVGEEIAARNQEQRRPQGLQVGPRFSPAPQEALFSQSHDHARCREDQTHPQTISQEGNETLYSLAQGQHGDGEENR